MDEIPAPDDRSLHDPTGESPFCILDPDGVYVWWFHDCDGGVKYGMHAHRSSVMLPTGAPHGWQLVSPEPLHIEPSVLCTPPEGRETHGHFRDGVWVPC